MPHYFFDIKNGHRLIDPTGLECRDDQEATAQATAIAAQIALDVPGSAGSGAVKKQSQRETRVRRETPFTTRYIKASRLIDQTSARTKKNHRKHYNI
jgi:hypothetical protein